MAAENIIRAISIRQPYVEAILDGTKKIEYRSRPTKLKERVYIYASKTLEDEETFRDFGYDSSKCPTGLIVGTVKILTCRQDPEGWYNWYLDDPQRLDTFLNPINQPQPGIWRPQFGKDTISNLSDVNTANTEKPETNESDSIEDSIEDDIKNQGGSEMLPGNDQEVVISSDDFFRNPILNSPYDFPGRHWELDNSGQPTGKEIKKRRSASFITPIPKPRKQKGQEDIQAELDMSVLSNSDRQYHTTAIINEVRTYVDIWRKEKNPANWQVTPETARLLQHWRQHQFSSFRPFFCQVEAVETAIWLSEVAPKIKKGKDLLEYLRQVNEEAHPDLIRLSLKLATGAGKTTVMAMLIAWQTLNAVRRPNSSKFTKGFLVITPGLTIKDRLRVLQPNDPDSYFKTRELVPADMLADINKAKIVITNYHAFKLRETMEVAAGTRALIEGWRKEEIRTPETEGQMIKRVMSELMGMKNVLIINDEAHHCYRQKPESEEEKYTGDEKKEAQKNTEEARLWISGIEAVNRKLGVQQVVDLSATPFFLRGSGYAEGTIFPWTMSDFSLMDAIECGIVKLPRVPVADNIPGNEMPKFRNLWEHIGKKMPKKGRGNAGDLDPQNLPVELQSALDALYGHYEKTFDVWHKSDMAVPPCFIIVCNNTSTSKLVYDYISGYDRVDEKGVREYHKGRFDLFSNFDQNGNQLPRPRTLLIDSEQLESGDALDTNFRKMAAEEIERFRREIVERTGNLTDAENITDQDLLREVMNTVGKPDTLGSSIRCVVSVSMLTEGWDANTVTHVLGIRAFGTQLLCEQVIGRALRRQSYELNERSLFDVEYADVLGIPFDFTAKPVVVDGPNPPPNRIHVKAVRPERDLLEIRFPRVDGYRIELPDEKLSAKFNDDSILELTPDLVGPSITQNSGIIGETVDLNLEHLEDTRISTILYKLAERLITVKWREPGEEPKLNLFHPLKRIARQWMDECLVCKGGTYPAQLMYQELADMACERITAAITRSYSGQKPVKAVIDTYNPAGSTVHVSFYTAKPERWQTDSRKSHINWVILDSDWEAEFCRVSESHPKVLSYVKNHSLGFEVPYTLGGVRHTYLPDFIVQVDDGKGKADPLNLIVEIKGFRGEDAKEKRATMEEKWIPGVNNLGTYGRWAYAEFGDVYQIESDFTAKVEAEFNRMVDAVI